MVAFFREYLVYYAVQSRILRQANEFNKGARLWIKQ